MSEKPMSQITWLIQERNRLLAEVQEGAEALLRTHRILSAKEAENAALREIVEAVATSRTDEYIDAFDRRQCVLCEKEYADWDDLRTGYHTPWCPVTRARALLQKSSEEVKR
jgi:hypothetical protein